MSSNSIGYICVHTYYVLSIRRLHLIMYVHSVNNDNPFVLFNILLSYMQGMNITSMFNSTICKQAYIEIIDQCITAQGLNLTELNMVFSSNNTAVYMPLLKRLITILCQSSGCRYSILDAYRTCFLGSLVSV